MLSAIPQYFKFFKGSWTVGNFKNDFEWLNISSSGVIESCDVQSKKYNIISVLFSIGKFVCPLKSFLCRKKLIFYDFDHCGMYKQPVVALSKVFCFSMLRYACML